jgi:hypothetical protein
MIYFYYSVKVIKGNNFVGKGGGGGVEPTLTLLFKNILRI